MPSTSSPQPAPSKGNKPSIVIRDVSKSFRIKHNSSFKEAFISVLKRESLSSNFKAVDGLNLEVAEGESIALMGRNGSGKSTTLKLLSGVMRPDSGWIRTRGRVAGLIEVGAGFNPNLTGRDNVYLNAAILGMSKQETNERFDDILEFSEIGDFIDTEVKHYSSGMYARLGFAVAVHTELDVLLVDEVLSVGDAEFRKKCAVRMQEMRAKGKTMFIVSHSTSHVRQLCDRGVVLHKGKPIFDGPVEDAIKVLEGTTTTSVRRWRKARGAFDADKALDQFFTKFPETYGHPTSDPEKVVANGGGFLVRCSEGIILSSVSLKMAHGLRRGAFLRAYTDAGGPEGDWGFLDGKTQILDEAGRRSLRFQNGTAFFSPDTDDVVFVQD